MTADDRVADVAQAVDHEDPREEQMPAPGHRQPAAVGNGQPRRKGAADELAAAARRGPQQAGRDEFVTEDAGDADELVVGTSVAHRSRESAGAPVYDDLPQYSAGCALKMLSPLMSRMVSARTLIQCMTRTGSVWR